MEKFGQFGVDVLKFMKISSVFQSFSHFWSRPCPSDDLFICVDSCSHLCMCGCAHAPTQFSLMILFWSCLYRILVRNNSSAVTFTTL